MIYRPPIIEAMQFSFYRLKFDEIQFINEFTEKVHKKRRESHSISRLGGEDSGLSTQWMKGQLIGWIGQYAYYKITKRDFMIPLVFQVRDHPGELDDGSDDIIFDQRVQVRSTGSLRHLALWDKEIKRCQFAVLMRVTGNYVSCRGYISTKEFADIHGREKEFAEYGNAVRRKMIHERHLHDIFGLIAHCEHGDKWFDQWQSEIKKKRTTLPLKGAVTMKKWYDEKLYEKEREKK